jgi:hypothetical protein
MEMKMAVESMEMALGAIPHPGRVPEQRLLSPEIGLQWRRCCETFCGWRPTSLGFSRRGQYIGESARSVEARGGLTMWCCGQRWACATLCCRCLLALLRLPFGLRVGDRKIGTSGFVSSNSENISFGNYLE